MVYVRYQHRGSLKYHHSPQREVCVAPSARNGGVKHDNHAFESEREGTDARARDDSKTHGGVSTGYSQRRSSKTRMQSVLPIVLFARRSSLVKHACQIYPYRDWMAQETRRFHRHFAEQPLNSCRRRCRSWKASSPRLPSSLRLPAAPRQPAPHFADQPLNSCRRRCRR